MINREDLTEGAFVWWRAERMFKAWSVPCKVVKAPFKPDPDKEWERFTLLSLDDMKETELGFGGEAHVEELSKTNISDVKNWLNGRKTTLKKNIIDAESALENAQEALVGYEKKMKTILEEMQEA